MGIEVRAATERADREAVFAFRYRHYCEQQGLLTDIADHERGLLFDDDDADSALFGAWEDGRVVGTIRVSAAVDGRFSPDIEHDLQIKRFTDVLDPERMVVLSRFLIEPSHRGGLVSSLLIFEVAQYCLARRDEVVLCECEPHLLGYYRSLGFRPYGEVYSTSTFLVVPLVLFVGDLAHLQAVGSPVIDLLPPDYCPPPSPEALAILDGAGTRDLADADTRSRLLDLVSTDQHGPSIFDGLSEAQHERLLSESFLFDFHAGDLIIGEQLSTRTLYYLLSGVVEIRVGDRLVSVATAGDLIGEMAMLLGTPRTATVRAAEAGQALSFSDRRIETMLESEPELAARILWNVARQMATKLRVADPESVPGL